MEDFLARRDAEFVLCVELYDGLLKKAWGSQLKPETILLFTGLPFKLFRRRAFVVLLVQLEMHTYKFFLFPRYATYVQLAG